MSILDVLHFGIRIDGLEHMIKRSKARKHFVFAVVLGTIFVPLEPAIAGTTFDLPYCPPVKDKKEIDAKELVPIDLNVEGKSNKGTKSLPVNPAPSSYEKAKNANLVPLPLIPSKTEKEDSEKFQLTEHKRQLQDLWAATIDRSADIQFAISVLQPTSNQKHATSEALKLVGNALFNIGGTIAPAGPIRTGVALGNPIMNRIMLKPADGNVPQVSVGETIVLYKIVRDTADGLVDSYRNYRRCIAEKDAALMDLADLDRCKEEIHNQARPATIVQFEYTLSKAQRDAFLCNDKVELFRQKLLDLAGEEAVEKLDLEIAQEKETLRQIVGRPDINTPLAPAKPSTAATPQVPRDQQ